MKVFLSLLVLYVSAVYTQNSEKNASIKATNMDSGINNIVWCGNDRFHDEDEDVIVLDGVESRITDILFMSTINGEVFVSNNHGVKWANMTQMIYKQFSTQLGRERVNIQSIQVSPADTKTMYLFGTNGHSFVAKNCGKKLAYMQHDPDFFEFKLSRENNNAILAHKQISCKKTDIECEVGERALFMTKDQGANWKKIAQNINYGTWDKNIHHDDVDSKRILMHKREYVPGKNNDRQVLVYSDDFFKTEVQIDIEVEHFFQTQYYLFVLTKSDTPDSYNLKIAPKEKEEHLQYKTQNIKLPIKRNKDHSFTVLDSDEGEIFLGINHQGHESRVTNIYHSDTKGQQYNLALLNCVRDEDGNVDFERILSNKGTFIANIYDSRELERLQNESYDIRTKGDQAQKPYGSARPKTYGKQENIQSIKKSVISFNQGSSWHALKAPEVDAFGKEYNCSGECSLHLVGRTENFVESIHSSESAHGVIIGIGNVGQYLDTREENMNTYLSNDGGHTWKEIRKHPHYYEIGDRGGLIVVARSNAQTNKLHYTWDLGESWYTVNIFDTQINIGNIIAEESRMSQKFLVAGRYMNKSTNKRTGVIISVDFTELHQRECQYEFEPENPQSDYEYFYPKNYNFDECIFGEKVKMIRRKQDARCFNPSTTDEHVHVATCECTEEDFECVYGFYRDLESEQCVPQNQKYVLPAPEDFPSPQPCRGTYKIPTPYRKIPFSRCEGGVDLGPIVKQCLAQEASETSTTSVLIENEERSGKDRKRGHKGRSGEFGKRGETVPPAPEQGIISKYGYIVLILAVLYLMKEKLIDIILQIISFVNAKMASQDSGYRNLGDYQSASNQRSYSSAQQMPGNEGTGLIDDDEDDQLDQV